MKTTILFLFAFIFVLSLRGNVFENGPINLVSADNSPFVVENYNINAATISEPMLEQRMPGVPEPIKMLFIGAGLIGLGVFARRKKHSHI